MKLFFASTSPFARKVRIAVRELGLGQQIEEIEVNPWTSDELRRLNPLAKVPTLVLDDGGILYESGLIAEYLNGRAGGSLIPPVGEARWHALRLQAMADGMATAAGRLYADMQRADHERSNAVMERQRAAIVTSLDVAHRDAATCDAACPHIGTIALFGAIDYLAFRFPKQSDFAPDGELAAACRAMEKRPSVAHTAYSVPAGNLVAQGR